MVLLLAWFRFLKLLNNLNKYNIFTLRILVVHFPLLDHLYRLVHWLCLHRVVRLFRCLRTPHLLRGDPKNQTEIGRDESTTLHIISKSVV